MSLRVIGSVVVVAAALSVAVAAQRGGRQRLAPGQECPPGTTETRPGTTARRPNPARRASSTTARSRRWSPPQHLVPKAKFPSIDVTAIRRSLTTRERRSRRWSPTMDSLNLRVHGAAPTTRRGDRPDAHGRGDQRAARTRIASASWPASTSATSAPAGRDKAVQQLEADIEGRRGRRRRGAESVRAAHPEARRLAPEDRRSGARSDLGRRLRRLDVPAFIHTAEPQEFFEPHDMHNERWLELSLFADRRNNQPGGVDVRRADDRAQQRVPQASRRRSSSPRTSAGTPTTWPAPPRCSTTFPTSTVEVGAVLYDLGRQPRAAHDFFVKYQDRILFGKDAFEPSEYPVLLAGVRDQGRLLRLLPQLPRVLEAVRHQPAGRCVEEAVLQERAARGQGTAAERLAAVGAGRAGPA